MFAVLKTGGKQYRVEQGDVLRVEKLQADAGDTIQFNEVLIVGDQIGAPFVSGAAVQATVIDQIKGEKVIHFVRRRRKHSSKRTKGHRQQLTLVRVTDILAVGGDSTGVKAAIGAGTKMSFAALAPVAATEPAAVDEAPKPKARRTKAAAADVAAVAATRTTDGATADQAKE